MLSVLLGIVLIAVFALVLGLLLVILALYVYSDYKKSKEYKMATVCKGTVLQSIGTERVDHYGSGLFHTRREKCEKYLVRYNYRGVIYEDDVLTRKCGLTPGSGIDVHVNYMNDKRIICSDVYANRFKQLVIGTVIAVILSAVIIYLKQKGAIS